MQRINTAYFYRLALKLTPLKYIAVGRSILDEYGTLFGAEEELRYFLSNSLIPPNTSFASGKELLDTVDKLTTNFARENPELRWLEVREMTEGLNRFEVNLQSDFAIRDTFIVSQKATFSTTMLSERGEALASEAAHSLMPSITKDLHEAGRCMAFELATAAAFHLFRAVESMVCGYGEYLRGKPFTKKERNNGLGGYANFLKQKELAVDLRIIGAIEQIAALHRNPTMHPEMHISNTEIIATVGIAISVIEVIAVDWKRRQETPETPLIELLPDDTKIAALLEESTQGANDERLAELRQTNGQDPAPVDDGASKKARRRTSRAKDGKKDSSQPNP